MADPPAIAPIQPPTPPPAPAAPIPSGILVPSGLFVSAHGARDSRFDAFYLDERETRIDKSLHPIESFFSIFTRLNGALTYDHAEALSARKRWPNPLRFANLTTVMTQVFGDLVRAGKELKLAVPASAKDHFDDGSGYYIFVPQPLRDAFKNGERPKIRVCLFFGVGGENNVFGLRSYFKSSKDCVLVTIPGIEGWPGYGPIPWGIGITTSMIRELLAAAGVGGLDFAVEVMAGYSTGYRGLNETIINKMVELKPLRRVLYLDAFYNHDDFPRAKEGTRQFDFYFKKNTQWAVDTALTRGQQSEVFIYAYTAGTPRLADGTPTGPLDYLLKSGGAARIHFLDLELGRDNRPPIANEIEKICLARLIQGGIDDYFQEKDVAPDIIALVKLLPERGSLGVIDRPGFINLYDWIAGAPQSAALAAFPSDWAFDMVVKKKLFDAWMIVSTDSSMPRYTQVPAKFVPGYWFRHRDFIQEICKETLLP